MEDDLIGRQPQLKTTSMEDNLNVVLSLAQLSPSLFVVIFISLDLALYIRTRFAFQT